MLIYLQIHEPLTLPLSGRRHENQGAGAATDVLADAKIHSHNKILTPSQAAKIVQPMQ